MLNSLLRTGTETTRIYLHRVWKLRLGRTRNQDRNDRTVFLLEDRPVLITMGVPAPTFDVRSEFRGFRQVDHHPLIFADSAAARYSK